MREQSESQTSCHRNGRFHDDFSAFRKHFPILLPATVVGGLVVSSLAINYWICVRSMGLVEEALASVIGWLRWKWTMRRLDSFSFERS